MILDGVEILPRDYKALKQYYEITDELYQKTKDQNEILKKFIMELTDNILNEIDKDGWCRLVIKKEKALKMKEFISSMT